MNTMHMTAGMRGNHPLQTCEGSSSSVTASQAESNARIGTCLYTVE